MPTTDHAWILAALEDEANGWSLGTFGAIAEFTRDPGEPAVVTRQGGRISVATDRGGMRLAPSDDTVPVAYETPNRDGETWSHAVALCLPQEAAGMNRRVALTELGPDEEAIRPDDRAGLLFDMGLGILQADICIRTADPALIETLRAAAGRSLFEPGNPAMGAIVAAGPHRVFVCRIGRAEVYQPIPAADGRSPEGPHTHVLPKLLRTGRSHAATTPIPDGLVPCAHLFPRNPVKDQFGHRSAFDPAAHARFQDILERFGDIAALELKRTVTRALEGGAAPDRTALPEWRHARATARVAIRQFLQARPHDETARAWSGAFDRVAVDVDAEDDEQPAHG